MRTLYYPQAEPSLKWLRTFALFYECVGSIVPEDWNSDLSHDIKEFGTRFPNAYQPVAPRKNGAYLYNLSADRLDLALNAVVATPPKRICMDVQGGQIMIPGCVFMHRDKLPPEVRTVLLRRNLLLEGFADLVNDMLIVERKASNLILAHIASEIGGREGWSTTTDQDIEFYFTSLGRLQRPTIPDLAQDLLASSVLTSMVPENIVGLTWNRYKALRDAYADIRRPLEELLSTLTRQEGLSRIAEPALFEIALNDVCKEFNKEIAKFSTTKFWRTVGSTTPVALGVLMTAAAGVLAAVTPQQAKWVVGLTLGVATVQVYQILVASNSTQENHKNVYQSIADMKRDILKPERFVSLF